MRMHGAAAAPAAESQPRRPAVKLGNLSQRDDAIMLISKKTAGAVGCFVLIGTLAGGSVASQEQPTGQAPSASASPQAAAPAPITPAIDPAWMVQIPWRSIGPANMSGRIVSIAVYEKDPTTYWIGTASGGLLKTTNAGVTYEHQFDKQATVSIGHVAVAASDPNIVWVGTGEANPRNSVSYGDGVYKSVDGGKTWTNMGLPESFQIGRIAIHPTDPNIVYVGALGRLYGPNGERGLYKTTDGGTTWNRVLYIDDNTGVIDVDMNPSDPNTLLVATYERARDGLDGNDPARKWGPGGGIWKTTDGGAIWKELTQGLPTVQLGRIGIDYYRKDPNVVFAVIETERITKLAPNSAFMGMAGEDAEVGARLTQITENGPSAAAGLKEGDIVLAINEDKVASYVDLMRLVRSHQAGESVSVEFVRERQFQKAEVTFTQNPNGDQPQQAFSGGLGGQRENIHNEQGLDSFEAGGIYRSADGGETWMRINSLNPRPMYYSQIRVDPSDEKYVYVLGTSLYRSSDGGATFTGDGGRGGVHVDHHCMWIDPNDGRHMILGNDGGIYVTRDRMENWDHHNHVAIGQFYHVAVDPTPFYYVYGGLQDNGSWGGPSRTRTGTGPVNSDWLSIGGGDGFVSAVDVNDPGRVYFSSQNGAMGRLHLENSERGFIRPQAGEGQQFRFNWKTPYLLSHHNSRIFYAAGNHVFRSLDRGDGLEVISPEITRTDEGSGSAIAESPRDADLLYAGTDDGALWVSRNGGHEWTPLFGVTEQEAVQEAAAQSDAQRQAAMLQQMLARLDRNEDGMLQRDEVPARMHATFDRSDLNKDGVIDASEIGQIEAAPSPPTAPADPVTGSWKAKLIGEGIPAEASDFQLDLKLEEGKVTGTLQSASMKGAEQDGTFNAETGEISLRFDDEAGSITVAGVIKDGVMTGTVEAAGGLLKINFEAARGEAGVAAETPAEEAAAPPMQQTAPPPPPPPPAPPAAVDLVTGTWQGQMVSDQIPPEMAGFTMTLSLAEASKVTGTVSSAQGDAELRDGVFDAATGKFAATIAVDQFSLAISAIIKDGEMTGSINSPDGSFSIEFKAKRGQAFSSAAVVSISNESQDPAPATDPVSGEWEGRFISDQIPAEATFTLSLKLGEGGAVTGRFASQFSQGDISSGSYNAETGALTIAFAGQRGEATITGKIEGDTLKGTLSAGGGAFTVEIEAKRTAPAQAAPPPVPQTPAQAAPATPQAAQAPVQETGALPMKGTLAEILPGPMWVASIEPSRYETARVYVCLDGHRSDNDDPWALVSEDYGQTWTNLRANLPRGSSRVLREDITNQDILYLGTEFGAWVSVDRGMSWTPFNAGNFPTVAVHEFAQHPTMGEIVAATHGRSLWITDVTPLRQMTQSARTAPAYLYKPNHVIIWRREPSRGSIGLRAFEGQNPTSGAQIYYSLSRQPGSIALSIEDLEGNTLRELEPANTPGLHRVEWDLRRTPQQVQGAAPGGPGGPGGRFGGGGGGGGGRFGRTAAINPGTYRVVLVVDGQRSTQNLEIHADPDHPTSPLDNALLEELEGAMKEATSESDIDREADRLE